MLVSFVDFTTGVSGHLWYNTALSRWVAPNISNVPIAFTCVKMFQCQVLQHQNLQMKM